VRYLHAAEIESALGRGRAVAQWLEPRVDGDKVILRWLCLEAEEGAVNVRYFEAFDAPDLGTYDLLEFPLVDPDVPDGIVTNHLSLAAAFESAERTYRASSERYLDASMIDDEYEAFAKRAR
jgi:hypothetical protein